MASGTSGAGLPGSMRHSPAEGQLTIRRATAADARALRRLAGRDGAREPEGEALIAEVDGDIVAALDLEEQRIIADPFRPTAEFVSLLELRAAHLRAAEDAARRRDRGRRLAGPLRALAR